MADSTMAVTASPPCPSRPPPIPPKSTKRASVTSRTSTDGKQLKRTISVSDTVFNTNALAEAIFLRLPMRDILVSVQRVSKTWHAKVRSSDALQQALFFKPIRSPITFVKPRRDIFAEKLAKQWEEAARIPTPWSTPTTPKFDSPTASFPPPNSPPPTLVRPNTETSTSPNGNNSLDFDTPPSTNGKRNKSAKEVTSPTNFFHQKLRRRRIKRQICNPFDFTEIPTEFAKPDDPWVWRSYPLDDARDHRQQIYENPLITRTDAAERKYRIANIGGRQRASWKRQFVTQPPAASVRVIGGRYGETLDLVVKAPRDGLGVRLGDVADALQMENLTFLTYEGRAWWRRYKWTTDDGRDLLDLVKRGVGEGPWVKAKSADQKTSGLGVRIDE